MDFRISDTFTDSLARLTNDEQKAVKTTAFDLQINPANPGMQFHKLEKTKDPNFWSVRVSQDLRLIVHRTASSLMLCYVDHHNPAYRWAERRKIGRHPVTGAMQLVELRESVREIVVPHYIDVPEPTPLTRRDAPAAASRGVKPLFTDIPEWVFLSYGVPEEWVADVRTATDETFFAITEHLPSEAAEALLNLAVGERLPIGPGVAIREGETSDRATAEAFEHPDAQRRFRTIENREELERALDAPWEKWTVFLHPSQRQLVNRTFSGPARVHGSAGTGKTIVALHRAVHLGRADGDARVLLTTFSETLANALRMRLRYLIGNEPHIGERLEVHSIGTIGQRLYERHFNKPRIATEEAIRDLLARAAGSTDSAKFTDDFVWAEWSTVVDPWQLRTWEAYRDVKRLGRKTRLPEGHRRVLWSIFERTREQLTARNQVTEAEIFSRLADKLSAMPRPTFDHVIVDESQDLSIPQLRFVAALGGARPNGLFFAGDLGQRIFQQPFSWTSLGVDVRGRASRLRINYRTSHQIRAQADRLLAKEIVDVDGIVEERGGTISAFNGQMPVISIEPDESRERTTVATWIRERIAEGLRPIEMALFVRSTSQIARAEAAAKETGVAALVLDDRMETRHDRLSIGTMHLAKGLEFRAVAVIACDDDVIPLQERMAAVTEESDLDDVYQTERHLLYVACTRARDYLLVTGVAPASEFISDLRAGGSGHQA